MGDTSSPQFLKIHSTLCGYNTDLMEFNSHNPNILIGEGMVNMQQTLDRWEGGL